MKNKKIWEYAKEDSIKIISSMFKKPGRIAAVFQLSWAITFFLLYKIKDRKGDLV